MWVYAWRDHRSKTNQTRHDKTPSVCCVAFYDGSLSVADASIMAQLRRSRDIRVRTLAGMFREFLGRHGAYLQKRYGLEPPRQQRQLHTGELQMAHAAQEFKQPTFIKARSYSIRENDHSSGFKALRDKVFNAFIQTGSWLGLGPRADVYDLVNCGPRNQFVVFGEDGPLIVHNCTQALCRDMLAFALVNVERSGWPIVLHVHDEIVTDVPNEPQYSAAELERLMCHLPNWAEGFPLAAEGQELMRYAK